MLATTCAVCGAEESLDALLQRALDDDQVRRLVADVVTHSLPVGAQLVSYMRLHKPPKQRLRMARVALLLGELVPDVVRGAITRKGRDWPTPPALWKQALDALFEARDAGTLRLPLEGNGYLYEVLLRLADRAENEREKEAERGLRSRAHQAGAVAVTKAINQAVADATGPAAAGAAAAAAASSQRKAQPAEVKERLQQLRAGIVAQPDVAPPRRRRGVPAPDDQAEAAGDGADEASA